MSLRAALRSQWTNVRLFRAFFPVGRTAWAATRFPVDYLLGERSLPYPQSITIEVTSACGASCAYCYNRDARAGRGADLAYDELVRVVREGERYRPGYMLTGGEPFLRADLVDLLVEIKRRGSAVGVITNGFSLSQEVVPRVLATGLDMVVVSLHGHGEAHDRVVGRKGAYARVIEVVERLVRESTATRVLVNYVLSAESAAGLPLVRAELARFPRATLRLAHRLFVTPSEVQATERQWRRVVGEPVPRISGDRDEGTGPELARTVEELVRVGGLDLPAKPFLAPNELRAWYSPRYVPRGRRCLFLWNSAYVVSDGTLLPCQTYLHALGNVRDTPLATLWNDAPYRRFRKLLKAGLLPACARCCKL